MSEQAWTEMTPRQRDAWIAEWMGYDVQWHHVQDTADFFQAHTEATERTNYEPLYEVYRGHGALLTPETWAIVPRYTSDLCATRLVLDEVERQKTTGSYAVALCDVLGIAWSDGWEGYGVLLGIWAIVKATSDQMCEAVYRMTIPRSS